jgi:hypothetical protein
MFALLLTQAALAADLEATLRVDGTNQAQLTFHDVHPGEFPALTVNVPDSAPVSLTILLSDVNDDEVMFGVRVVELRPAGKSRIEPVTVSQPELGSRVGTATTLQYGTQIVKNGAILRHTVEVTLTYR